MVGDRGHLQKKLALAFVTEAVSLCAGNRTWARMDEADLHRYVTESDLLLRAELERKGQERPSSMLAFGV